MSMYYYLYSDDDDVHVFVEDEVEYYDNDGDFVLLTQNKENTTSRGLNWSREKVSSSFL